MYEVVKRDWNSLLSGDHTAWAVVNRKTQETVGYHQQLAIANAVAALKNRGIK
jgi:hypothetical protein